MKISLLVLALFVSSLAASRLVFNDHQKDGHVSATDYLDDILKYMEEVSDGGRLKRAARRRCSAILLRDMQKVCGDNADKRSWMNMEKRSAPLQLTQACCENPCDEDVMIQYCGNRR